MKSLLQNQRIVVAIEVLLERIGFRNFEWHEGFDIDGNYSIKVNARYGHDDQNPKVYALRRGVKSSNKVLLASVEQVRQLILYPLLTSILLEAAPIVKKRSEWAEANQLPKMTAEDHEALEQSEMDEMDDRDCGDPDCSKCG